MADVTWGVKVSEELKQQITELVDKEGIQSKDFIQQMVNTYTLEKVKQSIPAMAEDLKELQTLTQRINNIYLNLGYRIENISKTQREEFTGALATKDTIIQGLQEKVNALNDKYDLFKDAYKTETEEKKEALDRITELTGIVETLNALVAEYKEKNNTLQGIVTEYKGYKEKNDTLRTAMDTQNNRIRDLEYDLQEATQSVSKFKVENTGLKDEFKTKIDSLNTQHGQQLEKNHTECLMQLQNQKDKAENALNKALLEQEKQLQEKLQHVQEKHVKEIEQYQVKYKELLEKMEKLQERKEVSTPKE